MQLHGCCPRLKTHGRRYPKSFRSRHPVPRYSLTEEGSGSLNEINAKRLHVVKIVVYKPVSQSCAVRAKCDKF